MAVDDHGLEALRKSADQVTPGDKSDHFIKVSVGAVPAKFDDVVLTYTGDDLTGVVYKLDTVTIKTLTLTYVANVLCRIQVV